MIVFPLDSSGKTKQNKLTRKTKPCNCRLEPSILFEKNKSSKHKTWNNGYYNKQSYCKCSQYQLYWSWLLLFSLPLLQSLKSNLKVGFLDDLTPGGEKEAVTTDVIVVAGLGNQLSLCLNPAKCEVTVGEHTDIPHAFSKYAKTQMDGLCLLGAPLFWGAALDATLEGHCRTKIHTHIHTYWCERWIDYVSCPRSMTWFSCAPYLWLWSWSTCSDAPLALVTLPWQDWTELLKSRSSTALWTASSG